MHERAKIVAHTLDVADKRAVLGLTVFRDEVALNIAIACHNSEAGEAWMRYITAKDTSDDCARLGAATDAQNFVAPVFPPRLAPDSFNVNFFLDMSSVL
jgi:hypothetical protein